MTSVLSCEQVRKVDQIAIEQYGMPGIVLMENAARGVVDILLANFPPTPVTILCGKGNNAGDGYGIARHLDNRGWPVIIAQLLPHGDLMGDALVNWRIAQAAGIPTQVFENAAENSLRHWLLTEVAEQSLVLDCMLGTGSIGEPRFPFDIAIQTVNQRNVHRIAVDVPTGLDCDTGTISENCFVAEMTCTFVASKPGFMKQEAMRYTGKVQVVDIGVPRCIIEGLCTASGTAGSR